MNAMKNCYVNFRNILTILLKTSEIYQVKSKWFHFYNLKKNEQDKEISKPAQKMSRESIKEWLENQSKNYQRINQSIAGE